MTYMAWETGGIDVLEYAFEASEDEGATWVLVDTVAVAGRSRSVGGERGVRGLRDRRCVAATTLCSTCNPVHSLSS